MFEKGRVKRSIAFLTMAVVVATTLFSNIATIGVFAEEGAKEVCVEEPVATIVEGDVDDSDEVVVVEDEKQVVKCEEQVAEDEEPVMKLIESLTASDNTTPLDGQYYNGKLSVKFFVLKQNFSAPSDGKSLGVGNYFPNQSDNGGVSGANHDTGYKGGKVTVKAWNAISQNKGDTTGKTDLNGLDSSYVVQPSDLGRFNGRIVKWYVVKYQDDGIHVDGYLAGDVSAKYHSNFGTDVALSVSVNAGKLIMPNYTDEINGSKLPERPGYIFKGWSTNKSGSTALLKCGTEQLIATGTDYYAQWEARDLSVAAVNGTVEGRTSISENVSVNATKTYSISANKGYKFDHVTVTGTDDAIPDALAIVSGNKLTVSGINEATAVTVYFAQDDSQTKELSVSINEYYIYKSLGKMVTVLYDSETISQNQWLYDANEDVDISSYQLDKTKVISGNKTTLRSVKISGTTRDELTLPATVKDQSVINLYYYKDGDKIWGTMYLLNPTLSRPAEITSATACYNYSAYNYIEVANTWIDPYITTNYWSYADDNDVEHRVKLPADKEIKYIDKDNGIVYTTTVSAINFYVIKNTTANPIYNASWHIDGEAVWKTSPLAHAVSVDTVNGAVNGQNHYSVSVNHGDDADTMTLKANTGYKFDGSYTMDGNAKVSLNAENTELYIKSVSSDVAVKLTAIKDEENTRSLKYTVNYFKNGALFHTDIRSSSIWVGSEVDTISVNEAISENAYLPEYEFDSIQISDNVITTLPVSVKDGTVINVYYKNDARLVVNFVDYDGQSISSNKYKYNDIVDTVSDPTRTDPEDKIAYTFSGWKATDGTIYQMSNIPLVTKNETYTATYTEAEIAGPIKQFTVKFIDYNKKDLKDPQTIDEGKTAASPENPSRKSYKFRYWKDLATGKTYSGAEIEKLVVTSDVTYQAVYKSNKGNDDGDDEEETSSTTGNITTGITGTSGVLGERKAPESGVLGEKAAPNTGDDNQLMLWVILLAASLGVGASVIFMKKSKKQEEK